MQKVSSRDKRSGPEEGKYLPFDPPLSKIPAWLTSLPVSQISPQSLRAGREIQESLQLFQHSCVISSSLLDRLHHDDSSRVCSSPEALEISELLSPRICTCRSNLYVPASSSRGTQRENQRELGPRAQCTYIYGDSPNRMSPYTCVAMCCSARSSLSSWVGISSCRNRVALPSGTSVMLGYTCYPSIRAPPKKDRAKILVDPDVHTAFTRRVNSVLVLALCE
jgi:hypothetical protein